MSSTTPFAGTSVPAAGVSLWLARFLHSKNEEEGLSLLAESIRSTIPFPFAIWLYPPLGCDAIGWIDDGKDVDSNADTGTNAQSKSSPIRKELTGTAPSACDLVRWSFPHADEEAVRTWIFDGAALCWMDAGDREMTKNHLAWIQTLLEWLTSREVQLRDAKLRSLGEFAAGAGHEINNPLGTILGRSQLLLRQETDPERRRWLAAIGGQTLRIRDMISDTMVFARPPAPKRRRVEIVSLVNAVVDRFAEDIQQAGVELQHRNHSSQPGPLIAAVDAEQFQVVCVELLRNALHAVGLISSGPRRIGLRLRARRWREADWIEFDLLNNGPPLTRQEHEHAFDPFFSGRQAGRGLGFGLTKCWRIVTGHGGCLGVHSTPEITVFRSLWPVEVIGGD